MFSSCLMQGCSPAQDRNLDGGFKEKKNKLSEDWNELRDHRHAIGRQQDFKISTSELWKHVKNIPKNNRHQNKQKSIKFLLLE